MKLFKNNEGKKTEKLPMWQGQKGVPLLLHSSNGIDLCCGNIRDRFCGE